ncbi:MAG: hypothetical protein ACLFM4_03265 [Phormidium sp.]
MKDSTETLVMFAQLLEAEPPILPPDALQPAQTLADDLQRLPETDINQAAAMIVSWMEQFPQEAQQLENAINRKEVNDVQEPSPDDIQYTIPNFQIVEETETTVMITPAPDSEPTSLKTYVYQTLKTWIQKRQ